MFSQSHKFVLHVKSLVAFIRNSRSRFVSRLKAICPNCCLWFLWWWYSIWLGVLLWDLCILNAHANISENCRSWYLILAADMSNYYFCSSAGCCSFYISRSNYNRTWGKPFSSRKKSQDKAKYTWRKCARDTDILERIFVTLNMEKCRYALSTQEKKQMQRTCSSSALQYLTDCTEEKTPPNNLAKFMLSSEAI